MLGLIAYFLFHSVNISIIIVLVELIVLGVVLGTVMEVRDRRRSVAK